MDIDEHLDLLEPDEDPVEASESDSPLDFPVVGTDLTPTPEMIAAGTLGNGSWDVTSEAYEASRVEVHQQIKAQKDERRHFFNEAAKDALLDAIQLHHRLVKRGIDVMDRIENPVEDAPVTAKDMQILNMAQKSSKELADRGMGKPKAVEEEGSTTSILTMLTRKAGS